MIRIILLAFTLGSVGSSQYFITEPEDVTANIGDEVILKCVVGDREGILQWTRNGFGLGTDPELPGYPRYSLTSDLSLKISPVSDQDVGEFQCQIGAGDTSRPLRSKPAKISVQLPPGVPVILGGETGVISVNEDTIEILECESAGGKPAARIDWRDESGKPFKLDMVDTRTMKEDKNQTFKTISSVRYKVERAMHNKTVICSAINIASTESKNTKVRLNVMYKPKVSLGINSGAGLIREGDNVILHCDADSNPAPYSYSWRKNGAILPGELTPYLVVEKIDNSFHSARIDCEARNSLGSDTAGKSLTLQYAPIMVLQPRSVTGKEGDEVTLSCGATSNPPARYIWFKDSNPQPIEFSDKIKILVSEYSVGTYRCEAVVEGFQNAESKPAVVSILEKPRIGTVETQFGYIGEDLEIICPVVSKTQSLNITWYYRGRVLQEGGKYLMGRKSEDEKIESILRIRKPTELDFGEYGCRADNDIGADYTSIQVQISSNFNILDYLPFIGSGVAGVFLVLIILLVVYCCRRKKPESHLISMNSEKPIIRASRDLSNKNLDLEDGYRPNIIDIYGNEPSQDRRLQNVHPEFAGYYGNPHLNSRRDEDRLSSRSSSQSTLPPTLESWTRPPPNGGRRSLSPNASEGVDISANSTLSSVLSGGSRSSRSHPESAFSSGEDSPLIRRGDREINRGLERGRGMDRGMMELEMRMQGGGIYEESRRMVRGGGGGGNYSDGEDGQSRSRNPRSGYYSDGERSIGGRRRMDCVAEEHHDQDHGGEHISVLTPLTE